MGDRGGEAESTACRYLERKGYAILARNFRTRLGELDIVARKDGVSVFVEVKYRRDSSRGLGVEAVSQAKRQRVIRAAQLYAAAHRLTESPLRFDVIAIDGGSVRHEEGAFDVDGR